MKIYKKNIILLVNSKSDEYVEPLITYLRKSNIYCKVANSKFEFDLYQLNTKYDFLVITEKFKRNDPKKIAHWANVKFNIKTIYLNEENLLINFNEYCQKILSTKILQPKLKKKKEKFILESSFQKHIQKMYNLSNEKLNIETNNTSQLCRYIDSSQVGYLLLEQDVNFKKTSPLSLQKNILKSFSINKEDEKLFKNNFIGSLNKGCKTNVYGIQTSLPDHTIIEKEGKLEVSAHLCSEKVKSRFNIYVKLKSQVSDYLYITSNEQVSLKKLNSLKEKKINLRVKKEDKKELETYLEISHIYNNKNPRSI